MNTKNNLFRLVPETTTHHVSNVRKMCVESVSADHLLLWKKPFSKHIYALNFDFGVMCHTLLSTPTSLT